MGDTHPKVRVAAMHVASVFLDREGSVEKACGLIEEAGANGARLIAFPETYLPGYPFWIATHTLTDGARFWVELFDNAVEVPSDATEAIGEAARRAGAYVVMGVDERDGGTLYNTLLYFDDRGDLVGRHRKLVPTVTERTVWGRGDARDVFMLDTPYGKLGGLICWEHTMDLARYALTSLGEQIHVAVWPPISAVTHTPHASVFDSLTEAAAKHHAFAGQTFVINVQSRIDEATLEKLGLAGRPDMARVGGGWTAVVGPGGQIIAGPHRDDEAIVYADLDLAEIVPAKFACDSAGHYARPDVFHFAISDTAPTVGLGLASTGGAGLPPDLAARAGETLEAPLGS